MNSPGVLPKTGSNKSRSPAQKHECLKGYATLSSDSLRQEILGAYEASKSLEAEYIKSLHKQIYLFDLENKYLRKEVGKIGVNASNTKKNDEDKIRKTNFTTANNQLTDDQRNELISDLVRKCDEIQEKLDREIGTSTRKAKSILFLALRKEQMDIFTHDILKLKNEKEILSKENQKKDQVIEELRENSSTQKDRLLEMEEKFEACKQALTIEIKRRKGLERKIGEERGNFPTSKKEASQHMSTSCETASSSADNRRDLCNSICELSKLVTSQAEELKQLKKVIYKSEEQRPSNSSFIHMQPKLTDDQMWKEATGAKGDSQSGVSIGRRRWRDAEELKTFEESGVHEDPIQPTEKKKTLSLKL